MDFTLTSEQQALVDSVRRFCEREYTFEQRRPLVECANGRSADHWRTFAELGWLGVGLAEELGGFGGGSIENALICEEFGRGLILEPLVAHIIAAQLLARLSPAAQSDRLAAMIAGEERIVLAHLEPEGRGDRRHIGARAEWQGERIRLSGHKSLVLGGADADHLLVSARDAAGVSLFLLDAGAPGVRRQIYRTLDNHRVADVWLENVQVGATSLVGRRGEAYEAIDASIDYGIVALCAEAVGAMDSALWMTRDYLKIRQQFGTTLNNFQALQHRMADMLIETELSRSILYQGISALETLDLDERRYAVSATKAQVGQAGLFVGGQAIQLHGGIGVTEEHAIGHYYKRLFVIAHLFGGPDQHRERCRELLLEERQ